ncbi:MAG: DUF4139 domain-containing protein [Myxococcota bacterium]
MSESKHKPIDSRATGVTLFEDRAEVNRRATVELRPGIQRILVGGVGAAVDDASLNARVSGAEARVLSTKVRRSIETRPEADDATLAAIEAEHRAKESERRQAELALTRAQARVRRAAELDEELVMGLCRVPRGGAAGVNEWAQAEQELDSSLVTALAAEAEAERTLAQRERELAMAALRSTMARREKPRAITWVEVEVEAIAAGVAAIELEYRTPCALWRPEHVVTLESELSARPAQVSIRTHATIWQTTGEEWKDARLRFSTARSAKSAAPPVLADDLLALRRKTEAEKQNVAVELRDQRIDLARPAGGKNVASEMPGVEDGGEVQIYEARRPATVPSDGQPFRVEIAELMLSAEVDRLAIPERSEAVFLRARANLPGKRPLLAGPAAVFRGTEMVGKSTLSFVAPGEPFELSLGLDDGLRVRRRESTKRETTALTGTQKITRTVRIYLSNLSGSMKPFLVKERVPVSEIGEVSVEILNRRALTVDDTDGFVSFAVDLPAGAHKELELSYRIEASSKVQLPL